MSDKTESIEQNGMVFKSAGTVSTVRMDSENMIVLKPHTPSGFERLVSASGYCIT